MHTLCTWGHIRRTQEEASASLREAGKSAPALTQQALYLPSLWQQSAGDGLQWLQL